MRRVRVEGIATLRAREVAGNSAATPETIRVGTYAVVHIVAGETMKDLVIPQVVEHMVQQAETDGPNRPARVVIIFLEPARVAARRALRERVREIQRLAPSVRVMLVPYISRLGIRANASIIGHLLRRVVGNGRVVFHCRGESAVMWAIEWAQWFTIGGIVADIRGAWPEEALLDQGFASLEDADEEGRRDFNARIAKVASAMMHSKEVLTVSPGMMEWIVSLGVSPDRVHYVPCCVREVTYKEDARHAARTRLGLEGKRVFAYLGTITAYQNVAEGALRFLASAYESDKRTHVLLLTNDPRKMSDLLKASGIPEENSTVLRVAQRDVATYLVAADAGILLREPNLVSRRSRPVKLGEYLASGLPVVVSRGLGRVDELIASADAGVVVDIFGRDDAWVANEAARVHAALSEKGQRMRQRALRLCEEEFLWSRYVDRVRWAYCRAIEA
jgi:glycosyltransferase involved in cell wall biosynthesis